MHAKCPVTVLVCKRDQADTFSDLIITTLSPDTRSSDSIFNEREGAAHTDDLSWQSWRLMCIMDHEGATLGNVRFDEEVNVLFCLPRTRKILLGQSDRGVLSMLLPVFVARFSRSHLLTGQQLTLSDIQNRVDHGLTTDILVHNGPGRFCISSSTDVALPSLLRHAFLRACNVVGRLAAHTVLSWDLPFVFSDGIKDLWTTALIWKCYVFCSPVYAESSDYFDHIKFLVLRLEEYCEHTDQGRAHVDAGRGLLRSDQVMHVAHTTSDLDAFGELVSTRPCLNGPEFYSFLGDFLKYVAWSKFWRHQLCQRKQHLLRRAFDSLSWLAFKLAEIGLNVLSKTDLNDAFLDQFPYHTGCELSLGCQRCSSHLGNLVERLVAQTLDHVLTRYNVTYYFQVVLGLHCTLDREVVSSAMKERCYDPQYITPWSYKEHSSEAISRKEVRKRMLDRHRAYNEAMTTWKKEAQGVRDIPKPIKSDTISIASYISMKHALKGNSTAPTRVPLVAAPFFGWKGASGYGLAETDKTLWISSPDYQQFANWFGTRLQQLATRENMHTYKNLANKLTDHSSLHGPPNP